MVVRLARPRHIGMACHIWNCNNDSPLEVVTNQRTRGHQYKLFKNRWETALRGNFFANRVVNLWNELPEVVTTIFLLSNLQNYQLIHSMT